MAIAEVIKFEGPVDALVWKHPVEDFNATSQLIVDETHEAILVMNGNVTDTFLPGRRTITTGNIPISGALTRMPTDGISPFPCKVFFINKVHQLDMLWGTQGPITLDDPLYDIFLHVSLCGSLTYQVSHSSKFMQKLVGFRDQFNPGDLVSKFRGIISSHVKDAISKIMINGLLSYFMINANLFEISSVVMDRLKVVFDEYGVNLVYFNIESIEVPDRDYDTVSKAKERRTSRLIEGYTWQEERQMMITEKFASNQGTMGNIGGAVGGFMVGGAFGGSIADLARNALSEDRIPTEKPPKNVAGLKSPIARPAGFDVNDFFDHSANENKSQETTSPGKDDHAGKFCTACGANMPADALFCPKCGQKQSKSCPSCNTTVDQEAAFCHKCGTKLG